MVTQRKTALCELTFVSVTGIRKITFQQVYLVRRYVIRKFEESHPHLRDFRDYLTALREESDRGAVLISTALIDEQLKKCIEARLLADDRVRHLLSGFNA